MRFQYDKEKDIWCLLNKGKSSNNSSKPTKQYQAIVDLYGENPSIESASSFIDNYIIKNSVDIQRYIKEYQEDWATIAEEYHKRAESIFGISLTDTITVFLTINDRCPYNITENYFFVPVPSSSVRKIIMHELWHFYTWYGLGANQIEKLGEEKYNELKESLTVLLNVECKDLLPESATDTGYPQHAELRNIILEYWEKDRNINNLWDYLVNLQK